MIILNTQIVNSDWLNWNTSWWRGLDTTGTKRKWRYSLWDMDAVFGSGRLTIFIPKDQAKNWLTTDLVGLETNAEIDEGKYLHILVEKDFPCKDRIDENKADFFESLAVQQEREKC